MNALTGWLTGLWVTRDDDFVAEALNHHLVFVTFLEGVADRVSSEGTGGAPCWIDVVTREAKSLIGFNSSSNHHARLQKTS
ncbi:hypothetical protein AO354_49385 [Pseudomonas syringae pv. syringae]|nr:hypothetical protein AO354_49385 [Pseudomonas syringae pv. syringae]